MVCSLLRFAKSNLWRPEITSRLPSVLFHTWIGATPVRSNFPPNGSTTPSFVAPILNWGTSSEIFKSLMGISWIGNPPVRFWTGGGSSALTGASGFAVGFCSSPKSSSAKTASTSSGAGGGVTGSAGATSGAGGISPRVGSILVSTGAVVGASGVTGGLSWS